MFPGLTSKVSEQLMALTTSIQPLADLVIINDTTSTTVLATIAPPFGGFSGVTFILNRSGANMTTVTTGNILAARTIPVDLLVVAVFSQTLNKYVIGAIS